MSARESEIECTDEMRRCRRRRRRRGRLPRLVPTQQHHYCRLCPVAGPASIYRLLCAVCRICTPGGFVENKKERQARNDPEDGGDGSIDVTQLGSAQLSTSCVAATEPC